MVWRPWDTCPWAPSPSLLSPWALSAGRYGSEEEFVADLKEMWFGLYSRGKGEGDSSGFEHIFSGTASSVAALGHRFEEGSATHRSLRAAPRAGLGVQGAPGLGQRWPRARGCLAVWGCLEHRASTPPCPVLSGWQLMLRPTHTPARLYVQSYSGSVLLALQAK